MKANFRVGAVACLLVVACNRPDTNLFGADGFQPIDDQAGAGAGAVASVGGSGTAGGVAVTGGSTGEGAIPTGGTATKPAEGGSAPVAGGPVGGGGTGTGGVGITPPDNQAGAPDSGGAPEPPPKPAAVCGNGIVEAGETCDDSGHTGKDGCDAKCNVACADFGPDTIESDDHHCYGGFDQADFEGAQAAC